MVDKIWYNMEELIGGLEERGINRNILECKDRDFCNRVLSALCINRNILECKDLFCFSVLQTGSVLIETYWNVKVSQLPGTWLLSSINRNILECKEDSIY